MTKLVIFDCDGVLADSEAISARVLVEELRPYDVDLTTEHVYRNFVGQSFPKVAAKIRNTFKVDLPHLFEEAYRARLVEEFSANLRATEGVYQVLQQLNTQRCVATSSSPPRVARTLDLLELAAYFEGHVFTASEVKVGKPAPDLFLHAAAQMGVGVQDCLVIEDSIAGILAAKAAGMPVWRYIGATHMQGFSRKEMATPKDVPVFDNWLDFYEMAPHIRGRG